MPAPHVGPAGSKTSPPRPGVSSWAPRAVKKPPGSRLVGAPSQSISRRAAPTSARKAATAESSAAGVGPAAVRTSGAADAVAGTASAARTNVSANLVIPSFDPAATRAIPAVYGGGGSTRGET
jgi:hypothetical protein